MEPTKVYKSLVYVAFNVVKNERLRYELYSKPIFKDQFVALINNMYALEKYHKQDLNGQQWGPIFARALVKTTNSKQGFSIPSGKTVDEIYADYSTFVSFTSTNYEIGRNVLVEEIVNFTPEEISADAELIEDAIKKYRELEIAKEQAAQQATQQTQSNSYTQATEATSNIQPENINPGVSSFMGAGNTNNPFMRAAGMNPMQNPRFYPYLTKPRWMPILKYVLATTTIVASVILIITMAIMMSMRISLGPNNDLANPYGNALFSNWTGNWNDYLSDEAKKAYTNFPLDWPLMATSAGSIISVIFYALPAIYMGYVVFKEPRSLRDKYRLSPFPVIFMVIFFVLALFNLIGVMSPNQLSRSFQQNLSLIISSQSNPNYGEFWKVVMQNYGTQIWVICSFSIIGVVLIGVTILMAVALLIVNPRVDRTKLQRASMEYERAMAAMIQGMSYDMDSSIFDEEDIRLRKPSRFRIWIIKRFKRRSKGKKPDNQSSVL